MRFMDRIMQRGSPDEAVVVSRRLFVGGLCAAAAVAVTGASLVTTRRAEAAAPMTLRPDLEVEPMADEAQFEGGRRRYSRRDLRRRCRNDRRFFRNNRGSARASTADPDGAEAASRSGPCFSATDPGRAARASCGAAPLIPITSASAPRARLTCSGVQNAQVFVGRARHPHGPFGLRGIGLRNVRHALRNRDPRRGDRTARTDDAGKDRYRTARVAHGSLTGSLPV